MFCQMSQSWYKCVYQEHQGLLCALVRQIRELAKGGQYAHYAKSLFFFIIISSVNFRYTRYKHYWNNKPTPNFSRKVWDKTTIMFLKQNSSGNLTEVIV